MKKEKKQFVVIGLGRFGRSVAKHLEANGCMVMAIDQDQKKVNMVSEYVTSAMCLDFTDEEVTKDLGLRNFDGAVISIVNSLEKSVLSTICLKEYGVPKVVVEAYDDTQGKVLQKLGADIIVYPEREMGTHLANNLAFDNFLDSIELSSDYSIAEIPTPKQWMGKSLKDLNLRAKYDINVIALKRGQEVDVTPRADAPLLENDILMILGENEMLKKISQSI